MSDNNNYIKENTEEYVIKEPVKAEDTPTADEKKAQPLPYTTLPWEVPGTDGTHTLYGKVYIPVCAPKGTVQIVHGMSEHIGRYDSFMTFLAQHGYVAFAHDQLGHGKTAAGAKNLGFIAPENGAALLVDDINAFGRQLLENYSGIPHILFGHSMGSFASRLCCEKYPQCADMLILMGTGGYQPLAKLGLRVTDLSGRIHGPDYKFDAGLKLLFTLYNRSFRDENSDHSWLSGDKESVELYENDERCSTRFSAKSLGDILELSSACNSDEWFDNFDKSLPTLIVSGELDPVGENGIGVMEVYKRLRDSGVKDITFKLYSDCRHELLNDISRDEVMSDILTWTDNRAIRD